MSGRFTQPLDGSNDITLACPGFTPLGDWPWASSGLVVVGTATRTPVGPRVEPVRPRRRAVATKV